MIDMPADTTASLFQRRVLKHICRPEQMVVVVVHASCIVPPGQYFPRLGQLLQLSLIPRTLKKTRADMTDLDF